jgi:hypothetical protein
VPDDTSAGKLLAQEAIAAPVALPAATTANDRTRETDLLLGRSTFDQVALMTLVLVMLHAHETWYLRIFATTAVFIGLLSGRALRNPYYWGALSMLLMGVYAVHWDLWLVNHKYAMTYVCLAVATSLLGANPQAALATQARLLIGCFFAFATFWKATSPDFLDGSFFHFTFLTDPRFLNLSELVGGLPFEASIHNAEALARLHSPIPTEAIVSLTGSERLPWLGRGLAWWTLAIEGLLAVVCLWPAEGQLARLRSGVLLTFLVTTFPIATVQGFAELLAVLGVAQCPPPMKRTRLAFLILFVIMPLCDLPFTRMLRLIVP